MTETLKIEQLKQLLSPDVPSDEELTALLFITKGAILNRRYPFGHYYGEEVPQKYEYLQLQMCVQLFNKKGAEGQTTHSENGITRNYEVGDIPESLLKQIIPVAGSVFYEES